MAYQPGPHVCAAVMSALSAKDARNLATVAKAADYSTTAVRATLRKLVAAGKVRTVVHDGGTRVHYRRAGK